MEGAKKRVLQAVLLVGGGCVMSLGLAILKLYVGLRTNSLCIMLDSINSFFDIATGIVAVVAFCLLLRPRDESRPFGLGRGEYLAAFVVAAVSVIMGGVFFFRSLNRLIMPEPIYYRLSSFLMMVGALVGKIAMAVAYGVCNKRLQSRAVRALLLDSLLDVGVTVVAIISFTVSVWVSFAVDAWAGMAVSVAVVVVGVKSVVDAVRLLLGAGKDDDTRQVVESTLLGLQGIERVVQVVVGDYGHYCKVGYVVVRFSKQLDLDAVVALSQEAAHALEEQGIWVRLVPASTGE